MFSQEQLMAVKTIITHADCADGMASAMILKHALPRAEVQFVQYGSSREKVEPGPGQLWCDMSPPEARAEEFVAAGAIVLDHHKTAKAVVERFGELGVFADENEEPGVSGALLAFRHVWDPMRVRSPRSPLVEDFALLAGTRDTWQRNVASWEDACAQGEVLTFYDSSYWLGLRRPWVTDEEMKLGRVLRAKKLKTAESLATNALVLGSCAVFPSITASSDVAEALRVQDRGLKVAVGFGYVCIDPCHMDLVFSLRSLDVAVDVSAIARSKGGGGHRAAAGFSESAYQYGVNMGPDPLECLFEAMVVAGHRDLMGDYRPYAYG